MDSLLLFIASIVNHFRNLLGPDPMLYALTEDLRRFVIGAIFVSTSIINVSRKLQQFASSEFIWSALIYILHNFYCYRLFFVYMYVLSSALNGPIWLWLIDRILCWSHVPQVLQINNRFMTYSFLTYVRNRHKIVCLRNVSKFLFSQNVHFYNTCMYITHH